MKVPNYFSIILVSIFLLVPIYQIYKYGLSGYYNKKVERRKQRGQQILRLFQ